MTEYHDHRDDCPFKFATLDACDCVEKNMLDRIEALTEQLAAAQHDAKEAEAYAEEVERELRDTQDRANAFATKEYYTEMRAERAEAKLAKAEAGLLAIAKRDEQMIWGEDYEVEEAFKDMRDIALATLAAVTETHKIKSSEAAPPYGLEGESHE